MKLQYSRRYCCCFISSHRWRVYLFYEWFRAIALKTKGIHTGSISTPYQIHTNPCTANMHSEIDTTSISHLLLLSSYFACKTSIRFTSHKMSKSNQIERFSVWFGLHWNWKKFNGGLLVRTMRCECVYRRCCLLSERVTVLYANTFFFFFHSSL